MKNDSLREVTADSVIEIATMSTTSLEGVTGMAKEAEGLKGSILTRDGTVKDGIKYSHDKEGNTTLDVYVRVKYGVKIPQLAWELQRKIQDDVNAKTGILLNDIHIHVEGVDMREGK